MGLKSDDVSVIFTGEKKYYGKIPFNPPQIFPEYQGKEQDPENRIYSGVRDSLLFLGLDKDNAGTVKWNPFGEIIRPGMTVFVKINTVTHKHAENKDLFSVITHASVLRPVLDYICIALKKEGRIIIGDSQLIDGNFEEAMKKSQIEDLLVWYRKQTIIPIECIDLRINKSKRTYLYGRWGRKKIEKDPRGYKFVNLGNLSYFRDIDPSRLRINIASYKKMYKYHSNGDHKYLFPGSVLASDVIINIAKLKTHRRTGVTLAVKNFMGIPSLKDSLPHFTTGSIEEGGDQYIHRNFRKKIGTWMHDQIQDSPFIPVKFFWAIVKKMNWNSHYVFPFKDDVFEAMWSGNDTVWRTLLDINRGVFYTDKEGCLTDKIQRENFCLIDGIIGGEKDGPIAPEPVSAGVFIAGFNPVAVDCAATQLMGFDIEKIRLVKKSIEDRDHECPIFWGTADKIMVHIEDENLDLFEFGEKYNLKFEPHPSWKGEIERS